MLRRWALPATLALLAMPSVSEALETCGDLLAGEAVTWDALLFDMGRGALMVTVALAALALRGRSPAAPLWLLSGSVLARVPRSSDRA